MDGWTVAVALVTAILGAGGGALLLQYLQKRYDLRKAERGDALAEWRDIANTQGVRIDALELELRDLRKAYMACQVEGAEMRGEVRALKARVAGLAGGAGGER